MISSILIEALARRAKALTEGMIARTDRRPDVADYRAAFEEEIRRFGSAPVDASAPVPVQPKRASLLPSTQPSLGKGIGQTTGGTAESDADEMRRILTLIANVDDEVIHAVCGQKSEVFVSEMQHRRANGGPLCVTGRQLFFARDILSQLTEKGYV